MQSEHDPKQCVLAETLLRRYDTMSRHFLELAVRARRFVAPPPRPGGARAATHRQMGTELTQFSFRLAFMIDLAYVSLGALGGAAIGQATWAPNGSPPAACAAAPRSDAGLAAGSRR